jgi:hypothetical protein
MSLFEMLELGATFVASFVGVYAALWVGSWLTTPRSQSRRSFWRARPRLLRR